VQLARQFGVSEKKVRRLLDLPYGSKLPRIAERSVCWHNAW
jgi:hypothetical protein